MTEMLNYIVAIILILGLALSFIRLFKTKVWIRCRLRKGPLLKIGFMDCNDAAEAPEVHLVGARLGPALGRVIIPDNSENANVELQTENIDSDSGRSEYKTCGFITPEGYIYKKIGNRHPEYVGYTARQSNPGIPTIYGKRTWRSLWMKCTLNVYTGLPDTQSSEDSAAGKEKRKKLKAAKMPLAVCSFTGFHNSRRDLMPPEARAAAFAAIYSRMNRRDYREYYNSPAYGWKDTALLSAIIYIIVYLLIYIVRVKILDKTMIGLNVKEDILYCALFFGIWALVRAVKIECIERSNTIQPRIDLFNKSLGQRNYDLLILLASSVILSFSSIYGSFYNLDFVPVAIAAAFGVSTNMALRHSNLRWKIEDAFNSAEEEDEAPHIAETINPEGEIPVNYTWVLDAPTKSGVKGDVTLYFDSQYISDLRHINPFFNQRNDKSLRALVTWMFQYMNEHASVSAHCRYLAKRIASMATENSLTDAETIQFTLDFVQEPNIAFRPNINSKAINRLESYIRFPDEVLFDKEADATSKALLAAAIFHFMARRTMFLYSRNINHAAIAVEVDEEWIDEGVIFGRSIDEMTFMHNGTRFIFCETTGDGLRLGGAMAGMRLSDFDERIELPVSVLDEDEDAVTGIYQWTLDSLRGSRLDGKYTIEFSRNEINDLRLHNPFRNYGRDSRTYDENIRQMFNYLLSNQDRMAKIRELAKYIRNEITMAELPEIDLVQFALDFCQAPNIAYKVDEESAGIDFAKEYMRFPDEVLFDKEGDCDCKSSLTAALFHELGYSVLVLISKKLAHAAIGIEFNPHWATYIPADRLNDVVKEHNGRQYLFCETTGDGYRIGGIQEDATIHDFDTIVEIPA